MHHNKEGRYVHLREGRTQASNVNNTIIRIAMFIQALPLYNLR